MENHANDESGCDDWDFCAWEATVRTSTSVTFLIHECMTDIDIDAQKRETETQREHTHRHTQTYRHMRTHTCAHTHAHTHTHTHTHTSKFSNDLNLPFLLDSLQSSHLQNQPSHKSWPLHATIILKEGQGNWKWHETVDFNCKTSECKQKFNFFSPIKSQKGTCYPWTTDMLQQTTMSFWRTQMLQKFHELHLSQLKTLQQHNVTTRVWCRGGIDKKKISTINLTTVKGACISCLHTNLSSHIGCHNKHVVL